MTQIKMFKSKIHRATITGADLNYEGSIKIDRDLLDAASMYEYEAVWIWNINNGERLMTYTINGPRASGVIELNGAAARLGQKGDLIIITTFADMSEEKAEFWKPTVVLVDESNKIKQVFQESGGVDGAGLTNTQFTVEQVIALVHAKYPGWKITFHPGALPTDKVKLPLTTTVAPPNGVGPIRVANINTDGSINIISG